jgi:flavorubredoxin
MKAVEIADRVHWIGVHDPELTYFDIVMKTEHGTSYNAYLVRGEKVALIDTVKREFADEYFGKLESLVSYEKIDYLVVNHTEPDHSGSMTELLTRAPQLELVCAASAVPFVKNVINRDCAITGVKDNATLELGGKTLQFKLMPYMHWPDTMMDFLVEDGVLFSNDGFAAHLASDSLWADEARKQYDVDYEVKYYYDSIMRPFTGYMRRNLPKLDELDISMIAPSHGPLFRESTRAQIENYKSWAADRTEESNQVTVFYASNYGNTRKVAESMSNCMTQHGYNIVLLDAAECDMEQARDEIEQSKAVMIGTPTLNGDAVKPIWDIVNLFATVYSIGKKAAVFGSYGWGGEGSSWLRIALPG